MYKKSQIVFVYLMVAVIIFIMAVQFVPVLNEQIGYSTNSSLLNCSDTTISTNNQIVCTLVDMSLFYFISVVIATGLALLAGRRTITGILTSIMVFIVVVLLITPLKDFIVMMRDSGHLNCAATTISVGSRMLCIFVDLWLFYFVVVAIAAGITMISQKVITQFEGGQ